jgi:hypothetical protein
MNKTTKEISEKINKDIATIMPLMSHAVGTKENLMNKTAKEVNEKINKGVTIIMPLMSYVVGTRESLLKVVNDIVAITISKGIRAVAIDLKPIKITNYDLVEATAIITHIEIDHDEWVKIYKPIKDQAIEGGEGIMFETYGKDSQRVIEQTKADVDKVWTLIDEESDKAIFINGCHYVNRLGYAITEEKAPFNISVDVIDFNEG